MQISEFQSTVEQMKRHGFQMPRKIPLKIPDANIVLAKTMKNFIGPGFKWAPEYDAVATWLAGNRGSGLFLYGQNGRGKTILGQRALPFIILQFCNMIVKSVDAQQMNTELEELLRKRLLSLDDVGTEDVRIVYGERRWAFPEIMDAAEKKGNLVIVSTNLGPDEITNTYGIRTLERIKATCTRVKFSGQSMR